MARSNYVWVAISGDWDDTPVRACTVKHEMVAWLRHLTPGYYEDLTIYRLNDNGDMATKKVYAVEDLLK